MKEFLEKTEVGGSTLNVGGNNQYVGVLVTRWGRSWAASFIPTHTPQPSLVISMQPWESLVKVQTLKPEFLFKSQIEPNRQVTLNTMLHLSSLSFFPCKMGIIMVLKPEVCSENYVSTSMLRTTWKSRADSHRVYSNTATDIPGVWPVAPTTQ